MFVSAKRLMATCAVAALATTIYGCSSDNDEDRLRAELDVAQMEAAEAVAEAEAARMEATDSAAEAEAAKMEATDSAAEAEAAKMEATDSAAEAEAAKMEATDSAAEAEAAKMELEQAETELEAFRAAQMMREQEAQALIDAQTSAGIPGGMARSPAPAVHAMSDQDTLANLLPGGEAAFAPLSVTMLKQYDGLDLGTRAPDLGAAYVKSISSDGMGGLRLTYLIDGEESVAHFAADQYGSFDSCCWVAQESDRNVWLFSWNDAFIEDPDDPAATDRTDGSPYYTYFDMHGGGVYGARPHGYDILMVYGARTEPGNLPTGTAVYEGTMGARVYDSDEPNAHSWMWGSLNLEANFDDSTVSGNMDVSTADFNQGDMVLAAGNSIGISNGMIDAGGFNADWAASGPMNAARHETMSGFEGTMVGEFYGPAAEEVGGVMSGHRAADGSSPGQILQGFFGGSQPEPEVQQ